MADDNREARTPPTESHAIRLGPTGAVWQSAASDFTVIGELFGTALGVGSGADAATEAADVAATG